MILQAGILLAAATATGADSFTADHLVRIPRVGAPVLSPAGDAVVYTLRTTDMDADRGRHDLWISNLNGSATRQLTTHDASDTSPAWSPDGRDVLFLSSRSGSSQVWRIAISGGEARQVTELPLDVGSFKLSPTGDRLVVSLSVYLDCDTLKCSAERLDQAEQSKVTAQAYDQLFMRHWDHWLDQRRSQLFGIALNGDGVAEGTPARLTRLDADVPSRVWGGSGEYSITPDGQTLVFAARLRNAAEPTSTNFDLYRATMDGNGQPENLTADNAAWDTAPVVTPDGKSLVYLAMSRPGFEADRFQVMLKDLASGQTRSLTADWDYSPSGMTLASDGRQLLMNAQDTGHKTLWRLSLDAGSEELPQKIIDSGYVSAVDAAGDTVVFARDDLGSPSELWATDVRGSSPRQLTRLGQASLENVALGDFQQFSFKGAGNATVYGWLVKPTDFERGKRYPVAFLIHGGPQGSFSNHFHYRWNPQTYAGQGFAAVMIDFHGSTGYGQEFTDSISGDWGGKPLEDLKLGLAAALDQFEFLDGDRVCALGASYGGYMINWIAGQWPDRFRCLVNHDGVFDQRSMYYTTEELWFPEWEHDGPYYQSPEAYEKHNPARFVDRWQTPMLVIHGELDYRVPVTQGIAAFTALQRRGIESRFLYFPDENHWVLKPHNSVRWHQEVNQWLKRFLQ
ncbi:MAG: S9 family peptidase [Xanthomonadales bacterium]|nr:S9 family peptidase [Xanthomonadales bacterium]